jgi:hypothetical protein
VTDRSGLRLRPFDACRKPLMTVGKRGEQRAGLIRLRGHYRYMPLADRCRSQGRRPSLLIGPKRKSACDGAFRPLPLLPPPTKARSESTGSPESLKPLEAPDAQCGMLPPPRTATSPKVSQAHSNNAMLRGEARAPSWNGVWLRSLRLGRYEAAFRSALVETVVQLTHALDQVATLSGTSSLRRIDEARSANRGAAR